MSIGAAFGQIGKGGRTEGQETPINAQKRGQAGRKAVGRFRRRRIGGAGQQPVTAPSSIQDTGAALGVPPEPTTLGAAGGQAATGDVSGVVRKRRARPRR